MLESFLQSRSVIVGPGLKVKYGAFVDAFLASLPTDERPRWNKTRVGRELDALGFSRGLSSGQLYIVGVALPRHDYRVIDGHVLSVALA
jgi:hypothetical protein